MDSDVIDDTLLIELPSRQNWPSIYSSKIVRGFSENINEWEAYLCVIN